MNQRRNNSLEPMRAVDKNIPTEKYLMLILYRAWKRGHPFSLGAEVIGAHRFDELVLEYQDDSGNEVRSLVRLRHNLDDTKRIRARDLLGDIGKPLGILQYFEAWRKIRDDPKFTGRKSKHFILYTNRGLDVEVLENPMIGIRQINPEDFDEFLIPEDVTAVYNLTAEKGSKLHHKLESGKLHDGDIISYEEISDFLGQFVLAVNQPNEQQLGGIIMREAIPPSTDFLAASLGMAKLEKYMLDWLNTKSRHALVKEDVDDLFNNQLYK